MNRFDYKNITIFFGIVIATIYSFYMFFKKHYKGQYDSTTLIDDLKIIAVMIIYLLVVMYLIFRTQR